MKHEIKVACVGNPNCGKTTLFNALTGSKLKVANWPGVTVEKVEGHTTYEDTEIDLIDTPGIYSLTCYTIEEKVTRKCVMDDDIDVIINVVDASSLERNLYLTLQLLELGKPVVLALNMMDIVQERGMELDLHRLPEMLGDISTVPVSAARRTGLDILLHAVIHHYEEQKNAEYILQYPEKIENKIAKLEVMMEAHYPTHSSRRWHAIKLLENDEEVMKEHPINTVDVVDRSYEKEIINCKYQYIESVVREVLFYKNKKAATTDKIDKLLTNEWLGLPMFLCIMGIVFFMTFTVGDLLKGVFEQGLGLLSTVVRMGLLKVHTAGWLVSPIVDGIINGVGGILTFLPNIFILFLALAILEDSGYMSRVAYVMDSIMGKVGLSGKAFLPMILGFGCTVPAIFSEIFFPKCAGMVAFSFYVVGIFVAIVTALIINKLEKGHENDSLLIELPEYKRPNARTVRIYVWNKVKDYLTKAGTTIFIASIIIWFILNFGTKGMVSNPADSFGAIIGKWLVPVLAPAGLGMWQIAVALISGIRSLKCILSDAVLPALCTLCGIHSQHKKRERIIKIYTGAAGIPDFNGMGCFRSGIPDRKSVYRIKYM